VKPGDATAVLKAGHIGLPFSFNNDIMRLAVLMELLSLLASPTGPKNYRFANLTVILISDSYGNTLPFPEETPAVLILDQGHIACCRMRLSFFHGERKFEESCGSD